MCKCSLRFVVNDRYSKQVYWLFRVSDATRQDLDYGLYSHERLNWKAIIWKMWLQVNCSNTRGWDIFQPRMSDWYSLVIAISKTDSFCTCSNLHSKPYHSCSISDRTRRQDLNLSEEQYISSALFPDLWDLLSGASLRIDAILWTASNYRQAARDDPCAECSKWLYTGRLKDNAWRPRNPIWIL